MRIRGPHVDEIHDQSIFGGVQSGEEWREILRTGLFDLRTARDELDIDARARIRPPKRGDLCACKDKPPLRWGIECRKCGLTRK